MHFELILTAQKKVLIALGFIVAGALVFSYFYFGRSTTPKLNGTAKLQLEADAGTVTVGQQFKLTLFFSNPAPEVASFDAVVTYDPEKVRVDEIKTVDLFQFYPRRLIEDFKNRFIVTGIQTDAKASLPRATGAVAEVLVTPLRSGKAQFQFLIDGDKYTNVMNQQLANILGEVKGTEVTVQE